MFFCRDVEGVVLDPSWLRPRDRRTEREAYNTARYEMRVLKRAGKTVLVRPSPDADRKLSGVPPPPKKEKPPKDRSPKWPVSACEETFHIAAVQRSPECFQHVLPHLKWFSGRVFNVDRSSSKLNAWSLRDGGSTHTKLGEAVIKRKFCFGLWPGMRTPHPSSGPKTSTSLGTTLASLPLYS
jgi:hypothetical protein